jgi:hypothetical protein
VDEVKARSADQAAGHGLDPAFVRRLYGLLIEEACLLEERLMSAPAARR